MDEPLNNLDLKHSVQTMKMMRQLADELGKTIIVVLHDINFASHYSDNIVALKDGQGSLSRYHRQHHPRRCAQRLFGVRVKICSLTIKDFNYF